MTAAGVLVDKNVVSYVMKGGSLGRSISCNDAWIAACAVKHGVPLVTHNAKDFEAIGGLKVVSEMY